MIDDRLKQDPTLEKYFTDEVKEPVFVKNLENVQGDERELILFTVGYGPDETGHMTLNFGPLNRDGGWRRLNVAVSRAKKEMMIFASMEPDQINLSKTKAEGLHSLRAFMEFAKRGNEPLLLENRKNNARQNSDIIIPKIQKVLHKHGYRVERNIGSSEFKVDLAVVDKRRENQYLAAIQLDGYRYAKRRTTGDRNKLSDLMLSRLGWKVIKVWSIEWWHNESKQIDHLLNQLKELENHSPTKENAFVLDNKKQVSIQEKISHLIIPENEKQKQGHFYEPVSLEDVDLPNDYFYTVDGGPFIQAQIKQIIEQEAPVSFNQLTKLITGSWGFSRSGAKIEAIIQDSITKMKFHVTTEEKGKFLWKDKEQYMSFTDFRIYNRERRPLQDISKIEYRNGVLEIMNTALRLPKADLIREILKQLGFNRTSTQAETYIQEAIDLNIEKGLILEDTEGYIEIKN
jgi:very-short-patch-repair endonuclease